MEKLIKLTLFLLVIITIDSCMQKGVIRFKQKNNEIVATPQIISFMRKNPNPSIVLRVPVTEKQATQSDPNNYIYNTIEKELVLGGFNVKDRGLFNEVINKSSSIDYEQVSKLTGVELILELVRVDDNFVFETNRVYNGSKEIILKNYNVQKRGRVVEFKLVIIKNNEYGGSYSFYDTPCGEGSTDCRCLLGYKAGGSRVYPNVSFCNRKYKGAYEVNEQNDLEILVRKGIKQMLAEIRKGN